jgi:CDP-6-deoxy-D-xylo-4-hexulose-3-dehydrase
MTRPRDPREAELREAVFRAVRRFHSYKFPGIRFTPGRTPIPASGKVFDDAELVHLVDSALDFWLTADRFAAVFEHELGERLGLEHVLLTNSGSSANLLAVSALTSPLLGERRLRHGDEVVTAAAGFPTTVNPIVQNGLVPVFVDIAVPTYAPVAEQVEAALTRRTKAVILAHTLGNPFDLDAVKAVCRRQGLWLIEDCCDALGSLYKDRSVSTFGDMATFSFYPAHHITMGEGGAVATSDAVLRKILLSMRDWGRDCWCAPGSDDTCRKRFEWKLGTLPEGYDHKYTYSHLGYNLKATEMQAAVGLAQLAKLDDFIARRKRNFKALSTELERHQEHLELPQPTPGSEPSWFGFPLTLRKGVPFRRESLTLFLEEKRIGTRLLFGGNILRQPYFQGLQHRAVGDLAGSDRVMRDTFWIGVYPGITDEMLAYVAARFDAFFKKL